MNKIIGYGLMALGVLVFAISYPAVRTAIKIPALGTSDVLIMVVGLAIILVGAFLGFKSSGEQHSEVPIYHGEKIVGYRRMTK